MNEDDGNSIVMLCSSSFPSGPPGQFSFRTSGVFLCTCLLAEH